jgi:hypothetical protein
LHPGKYRFFGSIDEGRNEENDNIDGDDEASIIDPRVIRLSTQSQAHSILQADDADEDHEDSTETVAAKRHRESAAIEAPSKKKKASGVDAMREVSDGMRAIAEAVKECAVERVAKDSVDSTIQGQAQLQVIEEACLTSAGHLAMVELLTDPTLARTYLVFLHKEELRVKWLKSQLEKTRTNGNIDDLFIDRDKSP